MSDDEYEGSDSDDDFRYSSDEESYQSSETLTAAKNVEITPETQTNSKPAPNRNVTNKKSEDQQNKSKKGIMGAFKRVFSQRTVLKEEEVSQQRQASNEKEKIASVSFQDNDYEDHRDDNEDHNTLENRSVSDMGSSVPSEEVEQLVLETIEKDTAEATKAQPAAPKEISRAAGWSMLHFLPGGAKTNANSNSSQHYGIAESKQAKTEQRVRDVKDGSISSYGGSYNINNMNDQEVADASEDESATAREEKSHHERPTKEQETIRGSFMGWLTGGKAATTMVTSTIVVPLPTNDDTLTNISNGNKGKSRMININDILDDEDDTLGYANTADDYSRISTVSLENNRKLLSAGEKVKSSTYMQDSDDDDSEEEKAHDEYDHEDLHQENKTYDSPDDRSNIQPVTPIVSDIFSILGLSAAPIAPPKSSDDQHSVASSGSASASTSELSKASGKTASVDTTGSSNAFSVSNVLAAGAQQSDKYPEDETKKRRVMFSAEGKEPQMSKSQHRPLHSNKVNNSKISSQTTERQRILTEAEMQRARKIFQFVCMQRHLDHIDADVLRDEQKSIQQKHIQKQKQRERQARKLKNRFVGLSFSSSGGIDDKESKRKYEHDDDDDDDDIDFDNIVIPMVLNFERFQQALVLLGYIERGEVIRNVFAGTNPSASSQQKRQFHRRHSNSSSKNKSDRLGREEINEDEFISALVTLKEYAGSGRAQGDDNGNEDEGEEGASSTGGNLFSRIEEQFDALYAGTCQDDNQRDEAGTKYILAVDFRRIMTQRGMRMTDEEIEELMREVKPRPPNGRIYLDQYQALLLSQCT